MKKVLLISGKIHAGKNQFADYLMGQLKSRGIVVSSDMFALGVKDGCKEDFKDLTILLNNMAEKIKSTALQYASTDRNFMTRLENAIDELKIKPENWYEDKTPITRVLLQLYGTTIFRTRVDEDWWVKQLIARVKKSLSEVIIVSDTRFPGELECFIKDPNIETYTIRIERNINTTGNAANHVSETALDTWTSWNYIIDNNGFLKDLQLAAKSVVEDIYNVDEETKEFEIKPNHVI